MYDTLLELLNTNREEIKRSAMDLSEDDDFSQFVQSSIFTFLTNLKRKQGYDPNDEKTVFCEVFVPLFTAFGNFNGNLIYKWCEKKSKDSDFTWLVKNDYKRKKGSLKLLDGVGRLVYNDKLNYLLIESSGFYGNTILSHSLNDTIKNIKHGHDNLKAFVSHYRNSSLSTMQKVHLFTLQIIHTKIKAVKYSIKSPAVWKVVECRPATVPLKYDDIMEFIKVFELFAFLNDDINEQEKILGQLKLENIKVIPVQETEVVGYNLL